jgi:hypothetical protein
MEAGKKGKGMGREKGMSRGRLWIMHTHKHTYTNCRAREGRRDDACGIGAGMSRTHRAERGREEGGYMGRGLVLRCRLGKKGRGRAEGRGWAEGGCG